MSVRSDDGEEKRGRSRLPFVSIVGLPNVGKSTLFNRLVGGRRAIVHKTPGVTRDRNVAEVEWGGRRFLLADTGGLLPPGGGELNREVENQVRHAIEDSVLILFLVDGRGGLMPTDQDVSNILRRAECRVLLVANKVEKPDDEMGCHVYNALGLGEPIPISAQRGINCGDLLDKIVELLPLPDETGEEEVEPIRIAVVGRPNAGKSSFINKVLGEDRLVVHREGGTTRDSIDTRIDYRGRTVILIDTAGLRRKSRIEEDLEYYANVRVVRSIERSDIVVLLVDSIEGIVRQDVTILSLVEKRGKGMVIAFSKWDLADVGVESYGEAVRGEIPHFAHVPILFTSALTGKGIWSVLDKAMEVGEAWKMRAPTPLLNRLLREAVSRRSPPAVGAKPIRLFYISQVGMAPPEFIIFTSSARGVKRDYEKYLLNFLRDRLELLGVPVRIHFKRRRRKTRVYE